MAKKKKTNSSKKANNTIIGIVAAITLLVGTFFVKEVVIDTGLSISGNFAVHFIDVGQGDSILIQTPDNEFMLIDTGERDQWDKLSAYLEHYNVLNFEYVIFTHPHSDHIGSADKIIKNYNVVNIIMPPISHTTKTFERLVQEIENKNLEITPAVCGDVYKFGEAEFTVLAPISDEYKDFNNYSVVIEMKYGDTTFLLTGDMEKESENEVVNYCNANNFNLSVDVLKVSHHGSSTSSQKKILDLIKPSLAVIMCGEGNVYNHPNMKTVDRIEKAGAKIYRTDLAGDIIIVSDGTKLSVIKGRDAIVNYTQESFIGDEYTTEQNEEYVAEDFE